MDCMIQRHHLSLLVQIQIFPDMASPTLQSHQPFHTLAWKLKVDSLFSSKGWLDDTGIRTWGVLGNGWYIWVRSCCAKPSATNGVTKQYLVVANSWCILLDCDGNNVGSDMRGGLHVQMVFLVEYWMLWQEHSFFVCVLVRNFFLRCNNGHETDFL